MSPNTFLKTLAYTIIIWSSIATVSAQKTQKIGDNPYSIDPKAVLELESTTKGFLLPRMTASQMADITSPTEGMMVYCTDCGVGTDGELRIAYNSVWQTFKGNLTGNVTGDLTGNLTSTSVLADGVTATTQATGDSSTKLATTAFVTAAASSLNFVDLTTAQTIEGMKTFNSDAIVNGLTVGRGNGIVGTSASNTAVGSQALLINTTAGSGNTAIGQYTLRANISGDNNTAIGSNALTTNSSGQQNTALGIKSLFSNTIGSFNTASGVHSLYSNTDGQQNAAFGYAAIETITAGSDNAVLGAYAGRYIFDGETPNTIMNKSVLIGGETKPLADNGVNEIVIGFQAVGNGSNTMQLGNRDITNVKTSGTITADAVTYPKAHGTSGQVLSTTGSGTLTWLTPSTTATAYSGILPVANGGTGSSTQNFVDLANDQSILGNKTFNNNVQVLSGFQVGSGDNFSFPMKYGQLNSDNASLSFGFRGKEFRANVNHNSGILDKLTYSYFNGTTDVEAMRIDNNSRVTIGGVMYPNINGTANQVLTTDGAGIATWTSTGLTNFTESNYSYSTKVGVKLLASNAATNVDLVLSSKGTGAILAQQPDGATTGGNNRGLYAVDFQMGRTAITQVASGMNAFIGGGKDNTAAGRYSFVGGIGNIAQAYGETVLGAYAIDQFGQGTAFSSPDRIFAIGNGTNDISRSNALTILKTGATTIGGSLTVNGNSSTKSYILPIVRGTSGQVLTTDGVGNATWTTPSTTATAYSGILPVANGGTGSSTQNFVDLTTAQNVGGLKTFTSNDGLLATGTYGSGATSSLGAGTRMMWYPKKAAFRTGSVDGTQWDDANIGIYSTALGNSTTASGNISIATGNLTTASGNTSTAMGFSTTASGEIATALGDHTTASGNISIAMGYSTQAKSYAETVIGTYNTDYTPGSVSLFEPTDRLFVIGNGTLATPSNALVMLKNGNTTFSGQVTTGVDAIINGVTIGKGGSNLAYNTAIGKSALAGNVTGGQYNTAIGESSLLINSTGSYNTAFGFGSGSTLTTGSENTLIGVNSATSANGTNAIAIGFGATASSNTVRLGNSSITNVITAGTITAGNVTYSNTKGTNGQVLITDAAGITSWGSPAASVIEVADEFTAIASQTSFTLTQTPSVNSKVKMFINGIRISKTAYNWTGTTLTYVPENNGNNALLVGDRIQFDYYTETFVSPSMM